MVTRDLREFWGLMEMINVLIVVVTTQLYTLVKTHQTVYLRVNFNVYNPSLTLKIAMTLLGSSVKRF